MEDRELWSAIQAGKEEAFKDLFYQYFSEMVNWAYHYVRDEAIAKDMAQDVFFKIWDRRKMLLIRDRIKPYLLQATRNNCLNYLKRKKNPAIEDHPEPEDNNPDAQEILQSKDLEKQIQKAIENMPDACRTIFLLRRTEELSLKDIARELQISPKTVENQLTKARKIVLRYLKPVLILAGIFFNKIW